MGDCHAAPRRNVVRRLLGDVADMRKRCRKRRKIRWPWLWILAALLATCQAAAFVVAITNDDPQLREAAVRDVWILAGPVASMWMGCCCAGSECCCPDFELESTAPATLTLTIDAPGCAEIDGHTATLTRTGGGGCVEYDNGSDVVGNCGSPVSMGWHLECATSGTGCTDFELTLTRSTLNCAVNGGASRTASAEDGCTCEPVLDLTFLGFNIDDSGSAPGTCDCCSGATFSVNIVE